MRALAKTSYELLSNGSSTLHLLIKDQENLPTKPCDVTIEGEKVEGVHLFQTKKVKNAPFPAWLSSCKTGRRAFQPSSFIPSFRPPFPLLTLSSLPPPPTLAAQLAAACWPLKRQTCNLIINNLLNFSKGKQSWEMSASCLWVGWPFRWGWNGRRGDSLRSI